MTDERLHAILTTYSDASEADIAEGMAWYQVGHTFARGLASRYGVSTDQACAVVAVMSPQLSWQRNMVVADELLRTGSASGCIQRFARKAQIIAAGGPIDQLVSGPKVTSFYQNLRWPRRSGAVTIDRHAYSVYLGYVVAQGDRTLDRKGRYDTVAEAYRQTAQMVGILPHQLQAITWLTWRRTKPYQRAQHRALYQREVA